MYNRLLTYAKAYKLRIVPQNHRTKSATIPMGIYYTTGCIKEQQGSIQSEAAIIIERNPFYLVVQR